MVQPRLALNCDWSERHNSYDNIELLCRVSELLNILL